MRRTVNDAIFKTSTKSGAVLTLAILKGYFVCDMCGREDCENMYKDKRFCKRKKARKNGL